MHNAATQSTLVTTKKGALNLTTIVTTVRSPADTDSTFAERHLDEVQALVGGYTSRGAEAQSDD